MKQKIKIMEHKPELSDEEIRSYMNFDGLITKRKQIPEPRRLDWIVKSIVPVLLLCGITVWFLVRDSKEVDKPLANVTAANEQSPEAKQLQPIAQPIEPNSVDKKLTAPTSESEMKLDQSPETKKIQSAAIDPVEKEDLYIQAEPQDGYPALYTYLNTHLIYPAESIKDSIQGIQTVSFIIDEQGNPGKIQVKQSLGESFEKEARRVIENMPRWKPASLNGKPLASQVSIPLTFQLQKVKAK